VITYVNPGEVVNDQKPSDDVGLDAAGILFRNTKSGRVLGSFYFLTGGSELINETGGYIGAPEGTDPQTFDAIVGSSGADFVRNSGTIAGLISLGGGNDTFVHQDGAGTYLTGNPVALLLGEGDDLHGHADIDRCLRSVRP